MSQNSQRPTSQDQTQLSLIKKVAQRFHVDADKLLTTLKATAFKQDNDGPEITNEHMMALLVIADQYNLNPFTREIYAFPDKKGKGIVPVVGVDGWLRIINSHKDYDGMELEYSTNMVKMPGAKVACPEWIKVKIYKKGLSHPIAVPEYLDEVYREPFRGKSQRGDAYSIDGPWQSHPKRMLRHKGIIQAARIAFGFTGIYDKDEAERIIDMGEAVVVQDTGQSAPLQLDYQKIDPILNQLIERSKPQNMWSQAYEWINNRFSGAEHAYAMQKVRDAEIESMPSSMAEFAQAAEVPSASTDVVNEPEVSDEQETKLEAVAEGGSLFEDDNPFV